MLASMITTLSNLLGKQRCIAIICTKRHGYNPEDVNYSPAVTVEGFPVIKPKLFVNVF